MGASCAMDHTTRLWDLSSLRCRQTLRGHVDSVNACAWQPFSNNICTASGDKTVSIWDARTVTEIGTIHVSTHPVNKVCFDRSGTRIVCAGDDGLVHGYSTDDLSSVLWSGRGHEDAVQGVCFDPADTLLSTSTDCA